jgi:hypothetical protein
MQNMGQGSDKKYRVLLLLLVGLASFTSAMKELNQVRDFSLQATNFVAQVKDVFVPADQMTTLSVETCKNASTAPPAPPLPALPPAPAVEPDATQVEVPEVPEVAPVAPAQPVAPKVREVPQPRRVLRPHGPAEVRVFFSADDLEKTIKDAFTADQSLKALKAKNRRYIYVAPEGHDVILKTLNRSITLRSAS